MTLIFKLKKVLISLNDCKKRNNLSFYGCSFCYVLQTAEIYYDQLETIDVLSKIGTVMQHGGVREDIVTLLQSIHTLILEHRQQ